MSENRNTSSAFTVDSPEVGLGGLRGFWRLLCRFVPFVFPFWDKLILRIACTLGMTLLGVLGALGAARIYDEGLIAGNARAFFTLAGGYILITLSIILYLVIYIPIYTYVTTHVDLRLKRTIFNQVQRMSLDFHQLRPIGENMFRINSDTSLAQDITANTLPEICERLIAIVSAASLVLVLNPFLAAMVAVFIAINFLFSQYVVGFSYRFSKRQRARGQEVSAILQENYTAFPISKALARERHDLRRYMQRLGHLLRATMGYYVASLMCEQGSNFLLFAFFQLGYMLVCASFVITNRMTFGEFLALPALILQMTSPCLALVATIQRLRVSAVPAQRMLETLDMEPSVQDAAGAKHLTNPRGAIEFQHVFFRYTADGPDVLKDVSFCIEPGRKLAIVGVSGAGKTSVFNLLMRFTNPTAGRILIDDLDIREIKLESYLQRVSVVLQENFLFSATIRDNILVGNIHANEEQLTEAVARAGLRPLVDSLPEGLDTVLLEGGNLSMGQKQRIAIARAVIRDPLFLFLDEATSSLDPATEEETLRQLAAMEPGRTRIVIAHHIASVESADEILVLDNGVIAQQGTHQDLIREVGPYRRLWAAEKEKSAAYGPLAFAEAIR